MADPISMAIIGWVGGGSVAAGAAALGTVGVALVEMGVGLALSALARAILPKPDQPDNPGIRTQVTLEGGTLPRTMMVGRYCTGGTLVAPYYSNGETEYQDQDYEDAYRWAIISLSDYPIHAVRAIWVNDTKFNMDDFRGDITQNLHGIKTANKPSWVDDADMSAFSVRVHLGRQNIADTKLTSYFGSRSKRPWTARMIGFGTAYAVCRFQFNPDLYQGDPTVKFELEGARLYDRRKDSTNGGTGTHREGYQNENTHEYTTNNAVIIENVMRGITMPDGTRWGLGVDFADLPQSVWNAAKNACDANRSDGSNKYRMGYEIRLATPDYGGDEPFDVIDQALLGCSGLMADVGGTFYIRVGAPGLPVVTINDDDILVDREQDAVQFEGRTGLFNAIRATFPNPAQQWQPTEAPLRTNAEWEAEDGERLVANVNFNTVFDRTQVRQLQAEYIKDSRRLRRHTMAMPPKFSGLKPLDVFAWDSVNHGYTAKLFEITEVGIDPDTLVAVWAVREVDPNDYDPEEFVDPGDPDDVPIEIVPGAVPGFGAVGVTVTDSNGAARRAGIKMFWPAYLTAKGLMYQIRVKATLADATSGTIRDMDKLSKITTDGILPNEIYEVRARRFGRSNWSAWITVTTPNVKLGPDDVTIGEPGDGLPATEPTGFTGIGIIRGVWLNWNNNPEPDLEGYEIYESATNTAPSGTTTPTFYVGPKTSFFGRLNLADSATRYYWIRARDSDGASNWVALNPAFVTTMPKLGITSEIMAGVIDATSFATGLNPVKIINTGTLPTTRQDSDLLIFMGEIYRWTGTAYVKSVKAADIVDQLVAGQISAGAITATQLAAGAVATRHLSVFDFESKQPVFRFGDGTSTAAFIGSNSNRSIGTDTVSGANSLIFEKNNAANGGTALVYSRPEYFFDVEPGEEYWIEAVFKSTSGATLTGGFNFGLRYYDAAGTLISSDTNDTDGANNDGPFNAGASFQREIKLLKVPATSTIRRASFYGVIPTAFAAGTSITIDRAVPRRANAGELIVDGTIKGRKLEVSSLAATLATIGTAWITRAHIVDGEIVRAKIGDAAINTAKIDDAAITTAKIVDLAVTTAKIKGYIIYYLATNRWQADKGKSSHIYNGNSYRLTDSNGWVSLDYFEVPRVARGKTKVRFYARVAGWGSDAPAMIRLERRNSAGTWVTVSENMARAAYQGSTQNTVIMFEDGNGDGNYNGNSRTAYRLRAQKRQMAGNNYDAQIIPSHYEVEHYRQNS